jgi:hypothetical protein
MPIDDLSYGGWHENRVGIEASGGGGEHRDAVGQSRTSIDENDGLIMQSAQPSSRGGIAENVGVERF